MSRTLYWSPTSPYVKKVLFALRELGVENTVTTKATQTGPTVQKVPQDEFNPNGKIPVLIEPTGKSYFGSQVILQYLDAVSTDKKILPEGLARYDELVLESMADCILDAILLIRYEKFSRPQELQWNDWAEGQKSKALRGVAHLIQRVPGAPNELYKLPNPEAPVLSLGGIACATACSYLDFRLGEVDWRAGEGKPLADWYEKVQARPTWKFE